MNSLTEYTKDCKLRTFFGGTWCLWVVTRSRRLEKGQNNSRTRIKNICLFNGVNKKKINNVKEASVNLIRGTVTAKNGKTHFLQTSI